MPKVLQLENNAPWKQRYWAPSVGSALIAAACPTRAILNDTHSGSRFACWVVSEPAKAVCGTLRGQIFFTPAAAQTEIVERAG